MANTIKIKRGSGSDPAASDMVLGEPVLRTDTAELFFKKDDGSVAKVSGGGGGPDFKYLALRNAANNGAASYPNADFTLVTSGTTNAITPAAANTLLVSVNGVIQKPNTGTSTPSSGFALSGSTIKFGANISAAPDFILYQESGGIGEPSDETVTEAKLKVSNNPVNGYFLSAQSGNTGGLTWAAPVATSCTGNSATATALATARAINGVNFDGTAAITVTAAAGTLSGTTLNSSVTASSLTSLGDLTSLTVTGDVVIADSIIHSGDTNTKLRFPANDTISFETGGSERVRIDSSGRVGIGTTSPAQLLEIHGASNPAILLKDTTNNVLSYLYSQDLVGAVGTASNHPFVFNVNNGEKMRIDTSGKVGIGTTSPARKFVVTEATANRVVNITTGGSSGAFVAFLDSNTTDDSKCRVGSKGGNDLALRGDSHSFQDGTGSDKVHIDSSGNVGIGTTSPSNFLEIEGGSTTSTQVVVDGTGRYRGLEINENGTRKAYFHHDATDNKAILNTAEGILAFATGDTERVRIDSSGHVLPATDSQYNIGSNGVRFANIYADTLYGDGSNLTGVSAGATGGGSDEVFYENSTTVTTSYSITSNKNAMSAGPISINNSVTVTVPSGSVWTIV